MPTQPDSNSSSQRPSGVHRSNKLNQLTGREWIRFTRSWFVHNPTPRKKPQIQHPAKFPESLVIPFIEFFTKPGQVVFDPFMGVGSTVLAAKMCQRLGIGIELNPQYYELAVEHVADESHVHRLFCASAADTVQLFNQHQLPQVDCLITSPPYWNMLSKSRGNVQSVHKQRQKAGLDTVYSQDDPQDLATIEDYPEFLQRLTEVLLSASTVLRPKQYMIVILQNMRSPQGQMIPLAWDLTRQLSQYLAFKGEKIWCQENKKLGIWGYPSEFVVNVHHHYCLVFKKMVDR